MPGIKDGVIGKKEQDLKMADGHNLRGHNSRWKSGYNNYHFHVPLEYEIVEKGNDGIFRSNVGYNEIKIRPLKFMDSTTYKVDDLSEKEHFLKDYEFWIPRRMIRRGPNSWSVKKNRYVHKETFLEGLYRCYRGDPFYRYVGDYQW